MKRPHLRAENVYQVIYNIPERLTSLVLQTTRITKLTDTLRSMRIKGTSIFDTLQGLADHPEDAVCSFLVNDRIVK